MFTPKTNMNMPRIWEWLSMLMSVSFEDRLINPSHVADFVRGVICGSACPVENVSMGSRPACHRLVIRSYFQSDVVFHPRTMPRF